MKINKERLDYNLQEEFYFESMINIAEKVLSSIDFKKVKDNEYLYSEILQAISTKIIYTCECWEVMQYYQTPNNANLENAFNDLLNDLFDITLASKE